MEKSTLGARMKEYENVSKSYLMRRSPVIIRLDMCHGHSFTRDLCKPYDIFFSTCMQHTMKTLCKSIQNCTFGYTQSDEISLVLCDYKHLDTAAWFDNQIEKIVSVSASIATLAFNQEFLNFPTGPNTAKYMKAAEQGAIFDSRAFNLAREEVCNYFIWRQQDATRNSIQSLAQRWFLHNELQGLSCKQLQDKLFTQRGIDWNSLPPFQKRGVACVKDFETRIWRMDMDIPIFSEDREYIEKQIVF